MSDWMLLACFPAARVSPRLNVKFATLRRRSTRPSGDLSVRKVTHKNPFITTGKNLQEESIGFRGWRFSVKIRVEGVAIQRIWGWRFSVDKFYFPQDFMVLSSIWDSWRDLPAPIATDFALARQTDWRQGGGDSAHGENYDAITVTCVFASGGRDGNSSIPPGVSSMWASG